ncbi:hypothetical protein [Roseateles sp. P5_E1]
MVAKARFKLRARNLGGAVRKCIRKTEERGGDRQLCGNEISPADDSCVSTHDRPPAQFTAAEQPLKLSHAKAVPRDRVVPNLQIFESQISPLKKAVAHF